MLQYIRYNIYRCISWCVRLNVTRNNYHRARNDSRPCLHLYLLNHHSLLLFLREAKEGALRYYNRIGKIYSTVRRRKFMRWPMQLPADQDILYVWRVAQMTGKVSQAVIMSKSRCVIQLIFGSATLGIREKLSHATTLLEAEL